MSGLFSLDKVKISYGKNEIVHGVSMDIAKGEFCALLGLNGSGKTTILHACCGFLPMEGSCIAADTECKGLNEKKRARLISFIPDLQPAGRTHRPRCGADGFQLTAGPAGIPIVCA